MDKTYPSRRMDTPYIAVSVEITIEEAVMLLLESAHL